jgi:hypothetical protein
VQLCCVRYDIDAYFEYFQLATQPVFEVLEYVTYSYCIRFGNRKACIAVIEINTLVGVDPLLPSV